MNSTEPYEVRLFEICDGEVYESKKHAKSLAAAKRLGRSELGRFKSHWSEIYHDGKRIADAVWQTPGWFMRPAH